MMKKFVSIFLIYVLVLLSCFSTLAQTQSQISKEPNSPSAAKNDLKAVFAKEIRKSGELNITMADIEKLEKNSIKSSLKKNNLSAKQKTWIWVGVGAAAAVTVLILLTRKDDDGITRLAVLPP